RLRAARATCAAVAVEAVGVGRAARATRVVLAREALTRDAGRWGATAHPIAVGGSDPLPGPAARRAAQDVGAGERGAALRIGAVARTSGARFAPGIAFRPDAVGNAFDARAGAARAIDVARFALTVARRGATDGVHAEAARALAGDRARTAGFPRARALFA